jgi:hypothetical protein
MTDSSLVNDFNLMLDKAAKEIYVPEHIVLMEKSEETVVKLRSETLGVLVSKSMGYNGNDTGVFLIHALYAALEDANCREAAGVAYYISGLLWAKEFTIDDIMERLKSFE